MQSLDLFISGPPRMDRAPAMAPGLAVNRRRENCGQTCSRMRCNRADRSSAEDSPARPPSRFHLRALRYDGQVALRRMFADQTGRGMDVQPIDGTRGQRVRGPGLSRQVGLRRCSDLSRSPTARDPKCAHRSGSGDRVSVIVRCESCSRVWAVGSLSIASISARDIASTSARTATPLSFCSAAGRRNARTETSRARTSDGPTTRSERTQEK